MDSRGEMTAFLYTVKNASIENLNGDQGEGRIAGLAHQSSCIGMGFSTEAEDLPCKRRSRRSADCGWNQNHLEDLLKLRTPPPEPLIQEVWERVKEFAFLTSSQIILLLPIQELHFKTHSSPSTEARQRRKKKKRVCKNTCCTFGKNKVRYYITEYTGKKVLQKRVKGINHFFNCKNIHKNAS